MSLTNSPFFMASTGTEFYDFPIEQSLRFNDDDNAYLSRTPASAGNRKTWTFSCWVKRGNIKQANILTAYTSASDTTNITFDYGTGNNLQWYDYISGYRIQLSCSQVFRDVAGWYHLVFALDTTQATASDRAKIWVNGERVTSFLEETYPSQNADLKMNTAIEHRIGDTAQFAREFDGYLADVNFVDGTAYTADSFGELKSGIWIPKDTADLTFGTNGFRLQFGDTTEANGFNTITYNGKGSTQSISGTGFSSSPDFVWIKQRDGTEQHQLFDTVRGAPLSLSSSGTFTENNNAQRLQSFDSDGFTLGNDIAVNQSAKTYVAWTWDAGSGSAASNTDGSITSTVKANTDYGFSIASFTGASTQGATFGHGLGVAPNMVIAKARNAAQNWFVYHSELGYTKSVFLNLTNASATDNNTWLADPTSSLVTIGDNFSSSNNYIAYCFAEKTGFSKFSSYTGTGATGNSITGLGFAPAFVMIKRSDSGSEWAMYDNTRQTSNPKYQIRANASDAENSNSAVYVDLDSDGFTIQTTDAAQNASGGTYIYMAFADTRNAAFWRDTSGEGNNWQPNNLVFSDVVPDSTTNNFGTWNPLVPTTGYTFSEGNLKALAGTADYGAAGGMFTPKTGKWYFEFCNSGNGGTTGRKVCGVASSQIVAGNDKQDSSIASGIEWSPTGGTAAIYAFRENGDKCSISATTAYGSDDAQTIGDVVGVALDLDNSAIYFSVNGVWQNSGDPTSGASQTGAAFTSLADDNYTIMMHQWESSHAWTHNGGQDSTFANLKAAGGNADGNGYGDFAYAPPSGFLSLCSANLPTGAIDTLADETPEDYFSTLTYSGTGATNSLTGVGFQPSLTWIKQRTQAYHHELYDAVRGVQKMLQSSSTQQETTETQGLLSFDSDGFTVGTRTNVNQNSTNLVSWNWKANGSGVSNTDGSITSTVSVGATSQQNWFSVSKYTGTGSSMTWGHGLGVKPDLFIVKKTNSADEWIVYPLGATGNLTQYLKLHSTAGYTSDSILETANSSVLGFGSSGARNGSGDDYICYSFANAEGLCKVGSYTGNGSSNGTFVYTGHKPSFVMVKRTDSGGEWVMWDNRRSGFNVDNDFLYANDSRAEYNGSTYVRLDLTSNGFKMRDNSADTNGSGATYIYLAIAEQPFKYANAR